MLILRQYKANTVKVLYEDWNDGKTFILRFKNSRESLKFENVCKDKQRDNLNMIENRKNKIIQIFNNNNNNK